MVTIESEKGTHPRSCIYGVIVSILLQWEKVYPIVLAGSVCSTGGIASEFDSAVPSARRSGCGTQRRARMKNIRLDQKWLVNALLLPVAMHIGVPKSFTMRE